jgi:hypothetical protein
MMNIFWQWFTTATANFVGVGSAIVVGTYIARSFFDRWLQNRAAKELERFKAELARTQAVFSAQFGTLHARRADALIKVYCAFARAARYLEQVIPDLQSGQPEHLDRLQDKAEESINDLIDVVHCNAPLIDEDLIDFIYAGERFIKTTWYAHINEQDDIAPIPPEQLFQNTVDPLRRKIADRVRHLLTPPSLEVDQ